MSGYQQHSYHLPCHDLYMLIAFTLLDEHRILDRPTRQWEFEDLR